MSASPRRLAETDEPAQVNVVPAFTERPAWRQTGDGWRHLHGSVHSAGASFEWHDFEAQAELDWGKSFHPGTVGVCLNLAGHGQVAGNHRAANFTPLTAGFYRRGEPPLR